MRVIPAIDLRDGACVQLVGGRYDRERVRLPDPLAVARRWRAAGFLAVHVVDLDAATTRGSNAEIVHALLSEPGLEIQVGGGLRDDAGVRGLLDRGAARVVVGTRAVEDPAWLDGVACRHPDRIVVAADVRGRHVLTRGWRRPTSTDVVDFVGRLDPLPLAGILVTAVDHEGRLGGTDLALLRQLAGGTRHRVYASGGISSRDELQALAACGVAAAVLGMALYTGALDPPLLAREFAA